MKNTKRKEHFVDDFHFAEISAAFLAISTLKGLFFPLGNSK